MEAAACISFARWIADNRPAVRAVEIDGAGVDVWYLNILEFLDDSDPVLHPVLESDDAEMWSAARESWEMLLSARRGSRHVVTPEEAKHWMRE